MCHKHVRSFVKIVVTFVCYFVYVFPFSSDYDMNEHNDTKI